MSKTSKILVLSAVNISLDELQAIADEMKVSMIQAYDSLREKKMRESLRESEENFSLQMIEYEEE